MDLGKKPREGIVIPKIVARIVNLAIDLVALVVLIPIILPLHMDLKKKKGCCAAFLVGTMGIIVSVLELVYRINLIGPRNNGGTWWQAAVNLTTYAHLYRICILR